MLQKTDARGVGIDYRYDALNRLLSKIYSDGTPGVSYAYDGGTVAYGTGRLASVSNAHSATEYLAYDAAGRLTASRQVTEGQSYDFAYSYNAADALVSETYPSGRVVTDTYDQANRVQQVAGVGEGQQTNYVTEAAYWPQGEAYYFARGNGVWHAGSFNSRLQPTESYEAVDNNPGRVLWVGCPNWGVNTNAAVYDFCPHAARTDDNGNLQSNTEYHGGAGYPQFLAFTQSYRYDGVNRLVGFSDSGVGSRSYGYDAYGNRQALEGNTVAYDGNNRIGGASYDAAGNQTVVNGDSLVYDAENRLTQATESGALGGGQATYRYDGDGRRVAKMLPGSTTVYVYDGFGQLAAEYSKGAVSTAACRTCYLSWDHLGSTRLVTDQEGKVVARHDYLPFGEEISANTAGRGAEWGAGSDTIQHKFTGKEHDAETGLDYFGARYYGSALGRFTSPDEPLIDQFEENPQSWNLYSYVRNNPLRNIDPTGNACIYSGSGDINNSSNYSDDNSGGQSCSQALSPQQNSTPSATATAQQGSWLAAVGTNVFLSVSNAANSYFSFIAPNSQLLSQTPNGSGTAANVGAGIGLAATLIGPGGEAEGAERAAFGAGRLARILRRHSAGSLAKNVSKFAKGLEDAAHVESMIESALSSPSSARGYADGAAYVDANLGVTIGTDPAGNPTTTIRVVLDKVGNVHSAFPVAQGHP